MKQFTFLLAGLLMLACSSNRHDMNFEKVFGTRVQVFKINPFRDTILTGEQGTKLYVPKDFISEKPDKTDTLKVLLKEYYSLSDMVLAGLTTTSNGSLIETAGMIHLEVRVNNKKVDSLKKGIGIRFNGLIRPEKYRIFYGNSDFTMNWEPDTVTRQFHLFYNFIGLQHGESDSTPGSLRMDTTYWDRKYTAVDSIITYIGSSDTTYLGRVKNPPLLQGVDAPDFIYNVSKLDWINCDRFRDSTRVTDIMINPGMKGDPFYYLIFENIRSIMANTPKGSFENVPLDENAVLIGLRKDGNRYYFGIIGNIRVMKGMIINVKMEETPVNEIKRQIRELDI
jgi:hypothetical protein